MGDARGPLTYQHGGPRGCVILAAEDSITVSDYDRLLTESTFTRPIGQVERVLLTVRGYVVPAGQTARVTRLSGSMHRVDYPGLDET